MTDIFFKTFAKANACLLRQKDRKINDMDMNPIPMSYQLHDFGQITLIPIPAVQRVYYGVNYNT